MMSKHSKHGTVKVKRVYQPAEAEDGLRVLVDRLWPRGVSKEAAQIDRWLKDIAPSHELRRDFHGHPERWEEFKRRYAVELAGQPEAVAELRKAITEEPVTLIYASRDEQFNNAIALMEYLDSGSQATVDD
jgi:uncharacterized protein YeaO (DUF488 family)